MPSPVLSPRTVSSKNAASDEEDDFILLQPEAGNVQVIPEHMIDAVMRPASNPSMGTWLEKASKQKKRQTNTTNKWVRVITRQKLGEHTNGNKWKSYVQALSHQRLQTMSRSDNSQMTNNQS